MDAQRRKESKGLGLLIIHCRHGHQWQGSSLAIFFQWHQTAIASFSFFPFLSFFFLSFWYLLLRRKGCLYALGTGGSKDGAKTQRREFTGKQTDPVA